MWLVEGAFVDVDVRRRICNLFPLEDAGIDRYPRITEPDQASTPACASSGTHTNNRGTIACSQTSARCRSILERARFMFGCRADKRSVGGGNGMVKVGPFFWFRAPGPQKRSTYLTTVRTWATLTPTPSASSHPHLPNAKTTPKLRLRTQSGPMAGFRAGPGQLCRGPSESQPSPPALFVRHPRNSRKYPELPIKHPCRRHGRKRVGQLHSVRGGGFNRPLLP